jgi:hypothetical protein
LGGGAKPSILRARKSTGVDPTQTAAIPRVVGQNDRNSNSMAPVNKRDKLLSF